MRRRLPALHICTQLTNIKLETQFFTAVTPVQFCVSKSPFIVTPLIAAQLAFNNTEFVNVLHPALIRSLHINKFLFSQCVVTVSGCNAKYIHSLFIK
jgi:hypothetical protein